MCRAACARRESSLQARIVAGALSWAYVSGSGAVLGKAQSLRTSEEQCFARRGREQRPEGRHRRCAQSKTAPEGVRGTKVPDKPVLSPAKQGGAEKSVSEKPVNALNVHPLNPPPPLFEMLRIKVRPAIPAGVFFILRH